MEKPLNTDFGDDDEAVALFAEADRTARVDEQAAAELEREKRRAVAGQLMSRELRQKLSKSWVRVNDLFRSWDANGDGLITRTEFMRGAAVVGINMSHDDVTQASPTSHTTTATPARFSATTASASLPRICTSPLAAHRRLRQGRVGRDGL